MNNLFGIAKVIVVFIICCVMLECSFSFFELVVESIRGLQMGKSLLHGLTPYGDKVIRHHVSNRANKLIRYLRREVAMLDQYQLDVNRAMLRKNTYFDRNYFKNLGDRRQRLIEIIELLKLIKVEIRKTPAIKADENEDQCSKYITGQVGLGMTIRELKELITTLEFDGEINDDSLVLQNYNGEVITPDFYRTEKGNLVIHDGWYNHLPSKQYKLIYVGELCYTGGEF